MKSRILVLSVLLVIAFAGCATVDPVPYQVVPATVDEVKAEITRQCRRGTFVNVPTVVESTADRLHIRWNSESGAYKSQVDLVYFFSAADLGTRVSLVERLTSSSINADGKWVERSIDSYRTLNGPDLDTLKRVFYSKGN